MTGKVPTKESCETQLRVVQAIEDLSKSLYDKHKLDMGT